MSMTDEAVLLSVDRDGVRTLTLNRAARKNAINRDLWLALADALRQAGTEPRLRALVITGEQRCILFGRRPFRGRPHPSARHKLRNLTDVALLLHELTVPTIAKVTGVAVGAGWNLALGCDLVVATPESTFCTDLCEARLVGRSRWFLAAAQAGRAAAGQAARAARRDDRRGRGSRAETGDVGRARRGDRRVRRRSRPRGWRPGPPVALAQTKALLNDGADATLREALANEARAQAVNFATSGRTGRRMRRSPRSGQPSFTGRWAVPRREQTDA